MSARRRQSQIMQVQEQWSRDLGKMRRTNIYSCYSIPATITSVQKTSSKRCPNQRHGEGAVEGQGRDAPPKRTVGQTKKQCCHPALQSKKPRTHKTYRKKGSPVQRDASVQKRSGEKTLESLEEWRRRREGTHLKG